MNKAIFLDRDGTINFDKGYLYRIEDFEFIPGAIDGLKILNDLGFLLIIITNQSGIARGFYDENDFQLLNEWMILQLHEQAVEISKVYYCPHHPEAIVDKYRKKCGCRKPSLGLFDLSIKEFDLDIDNCWAIGDNLRDLCVCKKYNCKGVLLNDELKVSDYQHVSENIYYSKDLKSAAGLIRDLLKG